MTSLGDIKNVTLQRTQSRMLPNISMAIGDYGCVSSATQCRTGSKTDFLKTDSI